MTSPQDPSQGGVSAQTLKRLPLYYNYLKSLEAEGARTVSSASIARSLRLGEIQARKDMASVSVSGGRPRTGFDIRELLTGIELCLGYGHVDEAVLVGAGNLGRALLSYDGFEKNGVRIVAAFDSNPNAAGRDVFGKPVSGMDKLACFCRRMSIRIGIITVPAAEAQSVCDMLVECGVLAVWNFAQTHLNAPEGILIRHENLAASLALLSRDLADISKP